VIDSDASFAKKAGLLQCSLDRAGVCRILIEGLVSCQLLRRDQILKYQMHSLIAARPVHEDGNARVARLLKQRSYPEQGARLSGKRANFDNDVTGVDAGLCRRSIRRHVDDAKPSLSG
jgi:hypothetical protein